MTRLTAVQKTIVFTSLALVSLLAGWPISRLDARVTEDTILLCPSGLPRSWTSWWEPPTIRVTKLNGDGRVSFTPTSYTVGYRETIDKAWYHPNNGTGNGNWVWAYADTKWQCLGNGTSFWLIIYTQTYSGYAELYWGGDEDPNPNGDVLNGSEAYSSGGLGGDDNYSTYVPPNGSLPEGGYECYDYTLVWTDGSGRHEQDLGSYCWAI